MKSAIEIHTLTLFDAITSHPENTQTLQIFRQCVADFRPSVIWTPRAVILSCPATMTA